MTSQIAQTGSELLFIPPRDLVAVNVLKDYRGSLGFYVPDVIIAKAGTCEMESRLGCVRALTCLDRYQT